MNQGELPQESVTVRLVSTPGKSDAYSYPTPPEDKVTFDFKY